MRAFTWVGSLVTIRQLLHVHCGRISARDHSGDVHVLRQTSLAELLTQLLPARRKQYWHSFEEINRARQELKLEADIFGDLCVVVPSPDKRRTGALTLRIARDSFGVGGSAVRLPRCQFFATLHRAASNRGSSSLPSRRHVPCHLPVWGGSSCGTGEIVAGRSTIGGCPASWYQ